MKSEKTIKKSSENTDKSIKDKSIEIIDFGWTEAEILRDSRRKKIRIEIDSNLNVTMKVPKNLKKNTIIKIAENNKDWIVRTKEDKRKNQKKQPEIKPLAPEEIEKLRCMARDVFDMKVRHFANIIGVDYGKITIRKQKTRWGSCTSNGNLNFNLLLMLAPDEVVDYVVIHELCHRLEMNHSKAFWNNVSHVMPDYKNHIKWLKIHGNELMQKGNHY